MKHRHKCRKAVCYLFFSVHSFKTFAFFFTEPIGNESPNEDGELVMDLGPDAKEYYALEV